MPTLTIDTTATSPVTETETASASVVLRLPDLPTISLSTEDAATTVIALMGLRSEEQQADIAARLATNQVLGGRGPVFVSEFRLEAPADLHDSEFGASVKINGTEHPEFGLEELFRLVQVLAADAVLEATLYSWRTRFTPEFLAAIGVSFEDTPS